MNKKLIVNSLPSETRIALLEENRVREIYIERHNSKGLIGNIYKAKVSRVLPGIQAAFVNIGTDRSAFLYRDDVVEPSATNRKDPRENPNKTPIQHILKDGQEILVQVVKEPLGSKGARVTMVMTIPGRYVVLMPEFDTLGVSRRIESEQVRDSLHKISSELKPDQMGLIVRTAAEKASKDQLKSDISYLQSVWSKIQDSRPLKSAPSLLYQEPEIILKTIRDLDSPDISDIIFDDKDVFSHVEHLIDNFTENAKPKLGLYKEKSPIFDYFEIEVDISRSLSRKVWLPSGGYLVIDQTEALTSFDVNSGKNVGEGSARETILNTNLESAIEIANQLRLRNLGGIIIIDFIDMADFEDQKRVNAAFSEALKNDKSRTTVYQINELGLVQMTRKRTRDSLGRILTEECVQCSGQGRVASKETLLYDISRDIIRNIVHSNFKSIELCVREDLYEAFLNEEKQMIDYLEDRYQITIQLQKVEMGLAMIDQFTYEINRSN